MSAKVLAFGVLPAWRRRGIGRALQQAAIAAARARGCYQVRSRSSGDAVANHQLKLSLGFGVHPIVAENDDRAAYYVLPLWTFGKITNLWDAAEANVKVKEAEVEVGRDLRGSREPRR